MTQDGFRKRPCHAPCLPLPNQVDAKFGLNNMQRPHDTTQMSAICQLQGVLLLSPPPFPSRVVWAQMSALCSERCLASGAKSHQAWCCIRHQKHYNTVTPLSPVQSTSFQHLLFCNLVLARCVLYSLMHLGCCLVAGCWRYAGKRPGAVQSAVSQA